MFLPLLQTLNCISQENFTKIETDQIKQMYVNSLQ